MSLAQTSTTVYVHIVDENDNAPDFPEEEYVTVLREGPETVGATIATVTAIDPDEGPNGTLRYAITVGNLVQTFLINNVTVRHDSAAVVRAETNVNVVYARVCCRVRSGEDYSREGAGLRDQRWTLHTGCHSDGPVSKTCSSTDIQHNSKKKNCC